MWRTSPSGAGCQGPRPDSSSGVSTPQSQTDQMRPDAGAGGREGPCQTGGLGPHPAQPHGRGVWGHSSQCPAGWPGGDRPGNVALSFKKERPLGMGQASTPASWGTTRLAQEELGGERGSARWGPPRLGSGEGPTPARTLRLRTRIHSARHPLPPSALHLLVRASPHIQALLRGRQKGLWVSPRPPTGPDHSRQTLTNTEHCSGKGGSFGVVQASPGPS